MMKRQTWPRRLWPAAGLAAAALWSGFAVLPARALEELDLSRQETETMRKETLLAIDHFQKYHYKQKPFSEVDPRELLTEYMKSLDYNKLFFLRSDKENFMTRFEDTLKPVYLGAGDLYPAFLIFETFRQRVESRLNWIFQRLEGEFDMTTDQTFTPDRAELEWPEDRTEADHLWEKRLLYELLPDLLEGETAAEAKANIRRRYTRLEKHVKELEPYNIQEKFLNSLANLYDPHSKFLSVQSMEEFAIRIGNQLEGIGALLQDEDGYCVIKELIPGGRAEMSGQVHPGDKIVEVAQKGEDPVVVVDMKLSKIVRMIRGPKGTEVYLTIEPADPAASSQVVRLVRDEIKLTAQLAEAFLYEVPMDEKETVPVGVISLPSFYGAGFGGQSMSRTTDDVEELLRKLKAANARGIILDLRKNGGGLLAEAVSLTGLFIPQGPVVQIRDTNGRIEENWDRDPKVVWEGPLVVLVSRRSASASEIVAGALQSLRRAIIVGDTATHGKGTVQKVFELSRGYRFSLLSKPPKLGAAKVTTQKFYLPNGNSTQKEGVHADIALPSVNDYIEGISESDLPNALVYDAIEPLEWDPEKTAVPSAGMISAGLLKHLREQSAARRESLEEFHYLDRLLDWYQGEKEEQEKVPLNLEVRRQDKEEDKAFRKKMQREETRLSQNNFPSRKIPLDLAGEKEAQHQEKMQNTPLPDGRPKANHFYQTVFYYQAEPGGAIKEVFIDRFDYEKMLDRSRELTDRLTKAAGGKISLQKIRELLQHFKNSESGSDYQPEKQFRNMTGGELTDQELDELISLFFINLIEMDPQVLEEKPKLDIPLRVGLRVTADWLRYNERNPGAKTAAASPKENQD